jgi:hypothetical protein
MSNHKVGQLYSEDQFFKWSNDNIYRTSTNDMGAKVPAAKKSTVVPGYQGHVPRIAVNNHHLSKTIAEQSREVFNNDTLDKPRNSFASTGFNAQIMPKTDEELHATSRRFGTETQVRSASNHQPIDYHTTTFRASYFKPQELPLNNWRGRDNSVQFDNSRTLNMAPLQSEKHASGYAACRQLWDSTYWRTEKNTHTDQVRTLYRMKFDQPKPFHKPALINNDGRLHNPEQVWDKADK